MHQSRFKQFIPGTFFALILAASVPSTALAADLVVSAAASLTNSFKTLVQSYEAKHPGTKVILNFGASDVLMQQIVQGAPADVFVSADQISMDKAVAEKVVDPATRQNFAGNQVVVITPRDSKIVIKSLNDLSRPEVKRVAYGNPASVPLGRYAKTALEAAGQWEVVSAKAVFAQNVRQTLDYVVRGEVDAGFVFATDAFLVRDKVTTAVLVPSAPVNFPLAITTVTKQPDEARRFVAFLTSEEGQAILARFAFFKPQ